MVGSKEEGLSFRVLIVAAGQGTRLGARVPKQYMDLGGKTVLRRTIEAFQGLPGLKEIRVVIDPAHEPLYASSVAGLSILPSFYGGNSRKESVFNGLIGFYDVMDGDVILVHDAARPFVRRSDILKLVERLGGCSSENGCDSATLALPITETVQRESCEGEGEILDRAGLWTLQTPQAFRYGVLRRAHEDNLSGTYTDDTALMRAVGVPVFLVSGHRDNVKITTPEDWAWAKEYVTKSEGGGAMISETRTASGFDVHAFDTESLKKDIRLCGIDIPSAFPLRGHSDADVGLHALTDALLGTVAAGDIGVYFPPSDPRWKGADSRIFVEHALALVRSRGGRVVHVDFTILCESPKIGPYRQAMQEAVAGMLGLSSDRVGLKATTTEGLGFVGRREGIAAQALVCVEFPRDPDHGPVEEERNVFDIKKGV